MILITFATQGEAVEVNLPGLPVEYLCTGVGKTCAAFALTRAIGQLKPELVLNIGTAGTLRYAVGDILACQRFIDRDLETTNLPGVDYLLANRLSHPVLRALKSVVGGRELAEEFSVNTGDDFVTASHPFSGDVCDMEAFAHAYVCREMQLPFAAVKYVTDIVGQNSVKVWEERLADARQALTHYFSSL
ncbi:MAG: nucleosidase [Alloprevotella sp.]